MLVRFDPFRELDRMTEEALRTTRVSRMPMDAYRRGDVFVMHFDLPGVDPDTIDLTVEQNTLTVTAVRTWPSAEGDELVITERPQGTFSRQLLLGDSLDTERMDLTRQPHLKRGGDYPQAWTKEVGTGRTFYTSLGHRDDIWSNDPVFRAHVRGGIRWALGLEQ